MKVRLQRPVMNYWAGGGGGGGIKLVWGGGLKHFYDHPTTLGPNVKKGKRKVQGVPQSQSAALPRAQEEEETDKSKQAQTEQTYEKHQD